MRGQRSKVNDTRVSPNGYHYTRTEEGWYLTHRIVAERSLGRAIRKDERVRFKDGDRSNIKADNLEVYTVRRGTTEKRKAIIEAKIEELKSELTELESEQATS